jgi:hypothetical protein
MTENPDVIDKIRVREVTCSLHSMWNLLLKIHIQIVFLCYAFLCITWYFVSLKKKPQCTRANAQLYRPTTVGAYNDNMTVTIKVKKWVRYMKSGGKAAYILNLGTTSC